MRYTDQDVEEVINAYFMAYNTSKNARGQTADASTVHRKAHEQGARAARAALEAMGREPLENVLRVKNWKVTLAHSHTSDGVALDDAWFAYVVDWHTGRHLAHENGATIDEAIRNAIAAAKGEE
jgi:hypothetical protein